MNGHRQGSRRSAAATSHFVSAKIPPPPGWGVSEKKRFKFRSQKNLSTEGSVKFFLFKFSHFVELSEKKKHLTFQEMEIQKGFGSSVEKGSVLLLRKVRGFGSQKICLSSVFTQVVQD